MVSAEFDVLLIHNLEYMIEYVVLCTGELGHNPRIAVELFYYFSIICVNVCNVGTLMCSSAFIGAN